MFDFNDIFKASGKKRPYHRAYTRKTKSGKLVQVKQRGVKVGKPVIMSDEDHLAAMRDLGVTWPRGRLPRYPGSMSDEQKTKADRHYDQMSEQFIDEYAKKSFDVESTMNEVEQEALENLEKALKERRAARKKYEKVKAKSKPGAGGRFEAVKQAAVAGGAKDPAAVAAAIGRKKYGAKKMAQMAAAGKKSDSPDLEKSYWADRMYDNASTVESLVKSDLLH